MKTSEMFEVCHSRYRSLRGQLNEDGGQLRPVVLEKPINGYSWRPTRARACEYVADYERIGRHALKRPEWKGRLKLFEAYFVSGLEYRRAIDAVGVAEGTFDYWFREVKRTLGAEFSRTGLFPPSQYFQARNAGPHQPLGSRQMTVLAAREPLVFGQQEPRKRKQLPQDSTTEPLCRVRDAGGRELISSA